LIVVSTDTGDGDLGRLSPAEILARQPGPVLPPAPPATRLPVLELSPEVFERLVLEYVWSVEAARDVHVYGRRGQKQYELDIVGQDRERRRFVYQVRRLKTITPSAIRAAVVAYAGPPRGTGAGGIPTTRRFDAARFVLATAASIHDDTALVDEIAALQDEYRGDLDIQVVGIEHLSVKLRDAAAIVAAFFGREWARAFCGVEPPEAPPGQATGFGLLEGPLAALNLEDAAAHAEGLRETQPAVAAEAHRAIADQLQASGYPGHAEIFRHRAGEDLLRAGDPDGGFDLFWQLGFDGLLRGDTYARLPELANWTLPPPGGVRQAKLTVLRAALNWYGQGSDLTATVPALRALLDADDPHALALITIVTEQALVDGLYATDPPAPMIGPATPQANLAELAAELLVLARRALDSPATPERDWRARLRCALADATLERCRRAGEPASVDQAYGQLIADTTAGRIPPGPAAVVHARAGHAYAVAGEPDQAIDSWRRAVIAALPDYGGDAREAFQSLTLVVDSQRRRFIPDLERISQAVPNRNTFLGAAYDPAVAALDDLRGGRAQPAFRNARRCVWEARLSGHLYDEGWALTVFADVMKATGRPAAELAIRVTAGDGKNAAAVAATLSDWVDLRDDLRYGPPWVVAAAAQALAAEADLVPDDVLDPIVGRLLDLAATAATAPLVAGQPSREAFHALAAFAPRIEPHRFDEVTRLAEPHLERETTLTEPAIAIVRGLYRGVPERRGHLTGLLKAAVGQPNPGRAWEAIGVLRQPGDALEAIARERAVMGDADALDALARWRLHTPEVRAAARRSAAVLLRISVGHQRNSWDFGGSFAALTATKVAVLVAGGDQDDDLPPAALAASPGSTAEAPALPDDAAVMAAGTVQPLAAAVLDKLLDLAADRYDMALERVDAVQALDILIPVLPGATMMHVARRLMVLAHDPEFGFQDDAEIHGRDPLRGIRMNLGGRNLASRALYTAVQAYRHAVTDDAALADAELAMDMLLLGETMLRSDDDAEATTAAGGLAILSGLAPVDLHRLAAHRLASVRATAIHGWAAAEGQPPGLPAQLAADPDAPVRRRVAQFADAVLTGLGPAAAEPILEQLRADRTWSVRYHLTRSLTKPTGDR
jgi:hypothetical protein